MSLPFPQLDFDPPATPGGTNDGRQSPEAPAGDPAQGGTPDPSNQGGAAQAYYNAVVQQRALQPDAYNNNALAGIQPGGWPSGALLGYSVAGYLNTLASTSSGGPNVHLLPGVWSQQQFPPAPAPPLPTKIVAGEIVGWRCWYVDESGNYNSMAIGYDWGRPGNFRVAKGEPSRGDQGVHAWKTEAQARAYALEHLRYLKVAIGTVELWGEVIEHSEGYRAEFAEICDVKEVLVLITDADSRRDVARIEEERNRRLTQSWRAPVEERFGPVADFVAMLFGTCAFLALCISLAQKYMVGH